MNSNDKIRLLYIDLFCGAGGTSTGVHLARHGGRSLRQGDRLREPRRQRHRVARCQPPRCAALHGGHPYAGVGAARGPCGPDAPPVSGCLRRPLGLAGVYELLAGQRRPSARRRQPHAGRTPVPLHRGAEPRLHPNRERRGVHVVGRSGRAGQARQQGCRATVPEMDRQRARLRVRLRPPHPERRRLRGVHFRRRFFGIFARRGLPIVFPEPTHTKNPAQSDLFGQQLRKWRPVREVLDLEDEGESIFDRKRPLVEASLARIHAGLVKFLAGGREAFLVKYNSMNQSGKYVAPGIDEPCPTVATQNRLGVAKVYYLCKHFGGSPEGKCTAVDAPAGAITCRDHHAFVSAYYGNGFNSSIERPSPTVTTKDRFQLVRPFFANYYSGGGQTSGTDGPAPAVMTNPKQRLVTPWIMNTNFSNVGSSLDAPAQTVTANRKWQYLMNPQFASAGAATDRPCFTLIARMDKRPPRLVTAEADGEALPSFIRLEDETLVYEIYPEDTPMLVQIKEFMALYGLVDIRMRMLRIPELMRIMGFPENYVLIGTQEEQKKFIGNAVEVNMARVLCEALVAKLYELNIVPQRFAA